MRLFFIGDIVGKPGRKILTENLSSIKEKLGIDVVVANGENSAGGNGISKNMADELFRCGIDAITLGDHIWDQRCFENEIDSLEKVCRPANIPHSNPGRDFVVVEKNGIKVGIFSLLGQTLMKIKADCPFAAAERMVEKMKPFCDIIFLDFHAETSSEKVSMGWHLDGKIQAIVAYAYPHKRRPNISARAGISVGRRHDRPVEFLPRQKVGAYTEKVYRRQTAPVHDGKRRRQNLRGCNRHRRRDKTRNVYRAVHNASVPQYGGTVAGGKGGRRGFAS